MEKLVELLPVALVVLGALLTALAAIAPLTKTKRDDDALVLLQKLMDFVGRLVGARVAPKAP